MRAILKGVQIARVLELALILLTFCMSSLPSGTQAIDTSLCSLVAHPKAFHKKRVRVRARFESNGVDRAGLFDDSCKGGVALWTAKETRDNPDQKALDDAIASPPVLGTAGKTITA